ncbi:hypothetical protein EUGRSUZ_B01543 [Eucalyptus grandis]|uniref:Uncharacterized protein n=2 Tax=Eucalyptus grandis TaxID=71139 RepID=A0A059D2R8_EUCGR|nr:hypothetical protein EUGRSUZ_B01543 [Eucalyptus grandis]
MLQNIRFYQPKKKKNTQNILVLLYNNWLYFLTFFLSFSFCWWPAITKLLSPIWGEASLPSHSRWLANGKRNRVVQDGPTPQGKSKWSAIPDRSRPPLPKLLDKDDRVRIDKTCVILALMFSTVVEPSGHLESETHL